MNLAAIVDQLRTERANLDAAIFALESLAGNHRRGRRPKFAANGSADLTPRPRRRMSAAARKRISRAMKARWAERRAK